MTIKAKIFPYFLSTIPKQYKEETTVRYTPAMSIKTKTADVGLSIEERNKIYPHLVGVTSNDNNFLQLVKEFNSNLDFIIPDGGKEINVTLDENGIPDNILDYILYKSCSVDPFVAKTEEEYRYLDGKTYRYKLVDSEKELKAKQEVTELSNKAMVYYAKLVTGSKDELGVMKLKQILVITRNEFNPVLSIDEITSMDLADLFNKLKYLVDNKPEKVVKVETVTDAIQRLAFVEMLIAYGIISVEGDSYFYENLVIAKSKKNLSVVISNDAELYAKLQAKLRHISAKSASILKEESSVPE